MTAVVLFYGAFILIPTVLIIFLILTSSLAFATWLFPADPSEARWETWLQNLLHTALLRRSMIFLWAVLIVPMDSRTWILGGLVDSIGTRTP